MCSVCWSLVVVDQSIKRYNFDGEKSEQYKILMILVTCKQDQNDPHLIGNYYIMYNDDDDDVSIVVVN
jgi:hypothetical protein